MPTLKRNLFVLATLTLALAVATALMLLASAQELTVLQALEYASSALTATDDAQPADGTDTDRGAGAAPAATRATQGEP